MTNFIQKLINTLKGYDERVKGFLDKVYIKNEEARIRAYANYLPIMLRIYKLLHPKYEPQEDLTVPLSPALYNFIYVKKFTTKESILIAEILEKYVKSGNNLDLAFEELKNLRYLKPYKRKLFNKMHTTLQLEGLSPAQSMTKHAESLLDAGLINALDVGHKSNRIQQMLNNYINDKRYAMQNKSKVKKALIYPIMVVALICGVCVAGKLVLLPDFMSNSEDALPPSSFKALIFMADIFLKPYRLIVLIVILGFIGWTTRVSLSLKSILHFVYLQLPVFNKYLTTKDICNFFINLHSEIDSGITTLEAHIDACETIENEVLKSAFVSKTPKMIEGTSLTDAYEEVTYMTDDVKALLRTAEKNGSLSEALEITTGLLKEQYQDVTDVVVSMIPTISILIAGIAIFILFIPILMGMYDIDSLLG